MLLLALFFAGASRADAPKTDTQKIADENEKTLTEQLARKLPDLRFNSNSLSDVVDFMRDATGTSIYVDWPALEAAGVARDAAVTYRIKDTSFSDAMTGILAKAAGEAKKLAYCTAGGVIFISTPDGVTAHQKLWKKHAAMATDKIDKFPAKLPDVRLNANSFSDVVGFLEDVTGCKIEVDWAQMQKDGIEKDTPVTAKLHDVPTLLAFQFIAASVSNEKATVDFRVEGDKIKFFSTAVKKP